MGMCLFVCIRKFVRIKFLKYSHPASTSATHVHTHAHTHTRTHAHTHTHIHTRSLSLSLSNTHGYASHHWYQEFGLSLYGFMRVHDTCMMCAKVHACVHARVWECANKFEWVGASVCLYVCMISSTKASMADHTREREHACTCEKWRDKREKPHAQKWPSCVTPLVCIWECYKHLYTQTYMHVQKNHKE